MQQSALDTLLDDEATVKIRVATAPLAVTPPPKPPRYFLHVAYRVEDAPLIVFNGWLRNIGYRGKLLSKATDSSEARWRLIHYLEVQGVDVPYLTAEQLNEAFDALEAQR